MKIIRHCNWTKKTTKDLDMCAPDIFVMFIAMGSSKLLVSLSTPWFKKLGNPSKNKIVAGQIKNLRPKIPCRYGYMFFKN